MVSSKYQVVIPEKIRKVLGIKSGSEVDVVVKGKIAYIVPIKSIQETQKSLSGKLNLNKIRDKKDRF